MSDVPECPKANYWSPPCKFEPRYDTEPVNPFSEMTIKGMSPDTFADLMTKKTYVRDVCKACGASVERAAK